MKKIFLFLILFCPSLAFSDSFSEAVAAYDKNDYNEAFRIFESLSQLGHIDATNNLATLYQTGEGTNRDYKKAAELYLKAAKVGHIDAAFNYSTLSRLGIGVPKNLADAYTWAIIAARNGSSDLVAYRDALATRIKPEEFDAANKQATKILEEFAVHEFAIGWLLPSEVKISARSANRNTSNLPIENLSPNQEDSMLKEELVLQITNENISKMNLPSYRSVFVSYPTSLNLFGHTLYRPMSNSARYSTDIVLRPRREVGVKVFPIIQEMEIDESIRPIFESISRTHNIHINTVIRSIQSLNPGAFEDGLPFRLKDPNYRLKIPNYEQLTIDDR